MYEGQVCKEHLVHVHIGTCPGRRSVCKLTRGRVAVNMKVLEIRLEYWYGMKQ